MRVLITNDDGIGSTGLNSLRERLSEHHEVWVVAPDGERSGFSHAITLHGSVTFQQLDDGLYSCSGTPADAVLYSLLGAIPFSPDVVVSGINHGPNIGTDIVYSGTVAAARQAALMSCPGIAVSLLKGGSNLGYSSTAAFIDENLSTFVDSWDEDYLINVNVPAGGSRFDDAKITRPARRIYRDRLVEKGISQTVREFTLEGEVNDGVEEQGTDWDAVCAGYISISPIYIHPLDRVIQKVPHGI